MGFDLAAAKLIQAIYTWGGTAADWVFAGFSLLGEEAILFILICTMYWALNKRLGEYLIFALYAAVGANGLLKDIVRRPRPFMGEYAAQLRHVQLDNALIDTVGLADSFSFPSGHSQAVASISAALMYHLRKPWVYIAGAVATVGVMASRVYLGVHYPSDTLVGAALGALCAIAVGILLKRCGSKRLWVFGALVAITASALLLEFSADTMKTVGLGVGALLGMLLDDCCVRFDTNCRTWQKVLRVVLGAALLLAMRSGLKLIFPANIWFDGLRYALVGFAGMGLWPLAFQKTKWLYTQK